MKAVLPLLMVTLVSVSSFAQDWQFQIDSTRFDHIDRTLKAATTMSIISLGFQVGGATLFTLQTQEKGNMDEENSFLHGAEFFLVIGGAGMGTNTPILMQRAVKQLKSWNCPDEQVAFKNQMLKNIRTAKQLSIIQNVMPFAGLAVGGILRLALPDGKDSQKVFLITFASFYAAGLALIIPEVILIEQTRYKLRRYRRNLSMGPTAGGMGLTFNF